MKPSKELREMIRDYEASSGLDAVYKMDRDLERRRLEQRARVYFCIRR